MPRWTRATLDGHAEVGTGTGHRTKTELSLSTKTAAERYERLRLQNEKLRAEMAQLKGSTVDFESIKRQVVNTNHTVKRHLLALPDRLAPQLVALDAQQIRARLHREIVAALNELAFQGQE